MMIFWLGMMFDSLQSVKCVQVTSNNRNHVYEITGVQAYNESNGGWENDWIEKTFNVDSGSLQNNIKLDYMIPSTAPS